MTAARPAADPDADPAVDLGSWSVAELLVAGFDRLGAVQPLLRPQAPTPLDVPRVRADLLARGLLEQRGGRWRPLGDLGVLMTARGTALLTVVVTGVAGPPVLLLGRFGGGDGLLQLVEGPHGCAAALRTPPAVAQDLAALALDGLPDGDDGPALHPGDGQWEPSVRALGGAARTLTLDAVLVDRDGVRRARRLTVVGTDGGGWLVRGAVDGAVTGTCDGAVPGTFHGAVPGDGRELSAHRCSRRGAVAALQTLLRGG